MHGKQEIDQGAMGDLHTFGLAGRARGVDDIRQLFTADSAEQGCLQLTRNLGQCASSNTVGTPVAGRHATDAVGSARAGHARR